MRLLGIAGAAALAFALWALIPSALAPFAFAPAAYAQDDSTDEVFGETQELIDSIQKQLDRMAKRAEARDGELESLARQIDEAAALLGDRGSENTSLRQKNAALSDEIGAAAASQGEVEDELRSAVSTREGVIVDLNVRIVELEAQLTVERLGGDRLREDVSGLTALNKAASVDAEHLESELIEARSNIAALTKDRSAEDTEQTALIAELRNEVGGLKEVLAASRQDKVGLQRTYNTLEGQYREALAEKGDFEAMLLDVRQSLKQETSVTEDRRRRNLVLRQEIAALKGELATRDKNLGDLSAARTSAETDKANLSGILSDLRDQLQDIKFALEASEERVASGDLQVADLRDQLDAVLAEQFDELAVFRSLLFARLRESLGEGPGIRILGESLVLQSELLFPSASADMREGAKAPLTTLARTLLSASRDAPIGLEWVLRVDGHTDSRPLGEGPFESNWGLSAERARIVVQYLAGQGVAPERLAAVGFGEYRPVDTSGDEIAFRRNRRVEFHLVAR